MPTRIAEYYNELQHREGLEPVELVAQWEQRDIEAISAAFRSAFAESRITEQTIPIRDRSTNQSIGNQVADFFVPTINRLDFIGPNTLVNIRLEASVSHRLLAEATHRSTTIP